ncbi:MAG: TonB-dependent receptor [Pseudomonadota bacterium]
MNTATKKSAIEDLKAALVGGVSIFALAPIAALAQDAGSDADAIAEIEEDIDEFESEDQIVITGSRIRRDEFTSISPVQVISGEVSRDLGLVDAQDILSQTSVVQGQQTTIGVSTVLATGQAFTTFGSVTPSLRGLSSSVTGRTRNLILVNGRRYGPIGVGGAPSNPDVTLIPGSLLSGVEILLDGASSIYGSDAIAGVINYRLRDDFEGLELDVFHTRPQIGEGAQTVVSATFGLQSDRGYALFAGEFNSTNGLRRADRFERYLDPIQTDDFGRIICDPEREINTNTGEVFSGCSGGLSDFAVFGPLGTTIVTPGQTNIGVPNFSQLGTAPFDGPDSLGTFGSINNPFTRFFPQDQQAHITPPTRRYSVYSIGEYETDLYTDLTAYYEVSYAERTLVQDSFAQGVIEVTDETPFNPGIGSSLLVPLLDFDADQTVNVFRATAGVRGNLPFMDDFSPLDGWGNWSYDAYALFHRSRGTQTNFGDLNNNNVARVLNGSVDTNGQFQCALDETLEGQQPSRAGPGGGFTTPITNCFAVNFFDPQFLTTGRFSDPASNDFILTNAIQNTLIDQYTINAFVSGDVYDIPFGGTVGFAAGLEYRNDSVVTQNDENQATPNALATQNPDVGSLGERQLIEGFAELVVPILQDQPFADSLSVEVATRYTEEQFFGAAWTWQAKGQWAPVDWLTFSGGYGTSFRAPDTGEQFGTGIIFANNTRIDPCLPASTVLATAPAGGITIGPDVNPDGSTQVIPENTVYYDFDADERPENDISICEALGVQLPQNALDEAGATALGLFGIGTPSGSFQNFSVLFANGGNTGISPETSRAFFAKVSFSQPWFDSFRFNFSANYFDYLVEDSIGQLTAGTILNACFNDPNVAVVGGVIQGDLCQFTSRNPTTGLLTDVNESSFNLGALTSRGIDFNLSADADLGFIQGLPLINRLDEPMNLSVVYRGTYQLENSEDITGDGEFTNLLQTVGFPEYQHNITTTLSMDRVSLLHRVFYATDSDDLDPDFAPFGGGNVCTPTLLERDPNADTSGCTEFLDLPPVILHDLIATYSGDTWTARFGVRNVFDTVIVRDAGIPADGGSGTPFGLGYDLDGRNFFFNISKRF